MAACDHPLCEVIGGACALAVGRSRGCGTRLAPTPIAPEVWDEIRTLVGAIDPAGRGRDEAIRLAGIIRREALAERYVLAQARTDEPELVPALERLCLRRR